MLTRRMVLGASALVAASGLVGCASEAYGKVQPRPLTTAESERLAVARFNNYDRGMVPITLSVVEQKLWAVGRVDYQSHIGYANCQIDNGFSLLYWSFEQVAAVAAPNDTLPEQPPQAQWQVRPMDVETIGFDVAITLALSMAADRPENPLLLQQNGSLWHGRTTVADVEVEVFTGPVDDGGESRLRYFIDDQARLRRVTAQLPRQAGNAVIEFLDGEPPEITSPF